MFPGMGTVTSPFQGIVLAYAFRIRVGAVIAAHQDPAQPHKMGLPQHGRKGWIAKTMQHLA